MTRNCSVLKCNSNTDGRLRRAKVADKGVIQFFSFPAWKRHQGAQMDELSKRRRMAWIAAVRRKDLTFDNLSKHSRVCSRHFLKGKPAMEMLEFDPDWAPSLHLGHTQEKTPSVDLDRLAQGQQVDTGPLSGVVAPLCAEINRLLEENRTLKEKVAQMQIDKAGEQQECSFCSYRRDEINRLFEENRTLTEKLSKCQMDYQFLENDDKEEPEPPQKEMLQRPEEADVSTQTLGVVNCEDDDEEDIPSHCSGVEVELESDSSDVTEDSDEWEQTSGGVRSQSPQTPVFSCPGCPYAFKSQIFFHRHMKRSHNDLYSQMERNGQIPSAASQQTTSTATGQNQGDSDRPTSESRQQLTETLTQPGEAIKPCVDLPNDTGKATVHIGGRPFKCEHCEKTFRKGFEVRKHQRVHTGEKPFCCKFCDMTFSQVALLKAHLKRHVHTREKSFPCNHCDESFATSAHLKSHQRGAHAGETRFRCKHCGKGFSTLESLKIHTEEKPLPCQHCGKSFSTLESLKAHLKGVHAEENPLPCEHCGESFSVLESLKTHVEGVHAGEKACKHSGKSFGRSGAPSEHQRILTGE